MFDKDGHCGKKMLHKTKNAAIMFSRRQCFGVPIHIIDIRSSIILPLLLSLLGPLLFTQLLIPSRAINCTNQHTHLNWNGYYVLCFTGPPPYLHTCMGQLANWCKRESVPAVRWEAPIEPHVSLRVKAGLEAKLSLPALMWKPYRKLCLNLVTVSKGPRRNQQQGQ